MTTIIRRKRPMTAKAMAAQFGISVRTVQRVFAQPRAEFLAENNAAREKPWAALGISRRTWYSRGKPTEPVIKPPKPWQILGISRATWYRKGKPMPTAVPVYEPSELVI